MPSPTAPASAIRSARAARFGIDPEQSRPAGARIDSSGRYRYSLWRIWDAAQPGVLFILLNPSTADARRDDPTLRRCVGFARQWGFGGVSIVNLFALRSAAPRDLRNAADPVGPRNDGAIVAARRAATLAVAAWGNDGAWQRRDEAVLALLRPFGELFCLGRTARGAPRHPLYLPRVTTLSPYV